jgi:hypothetical protein
MQVMCDKCGSDTKPKQITSKKTGKPYTLYECQGTCMNGNYRYSCFAPKVGKESVASKSVPVDALLPILEDMKAVLCAINSKIGGKIVKTAKKALDVDEDGVPFPDEDDDPFK